MEKVDFLLTGASGFLGQIISKRLSSSYSVLTLGRNPSSNIVDDITSSSLKIDEEIKINSVIHAAGKAHTIPRNSIEEKDFYRVNLESTKNLAKALSSRRETPESFIFISTVAVYGRESGNLIDEEHPLNGSTPYAKSKIAAEEFLQDWSKKEKIKLTILRLPLVVGANPPGNLGAMIKLMKKGLYFGIGKGAAKRSMVLADDVADFIPMVAGSGGIYNLTDGYHSSILQFENAVADALKKKAPIRFSESLLKSAATMGDYFGKKFPLNTNRFEKLTSSLTFSDQKARRMVEWNPRPVLGNLSI